MTDSFGQGQEERRRHQRVPFIEEILIDGIKKCTSEDISEVGLFITTIHRFELDEVIEVTIPTKEDPLTVKAQVKYCQPGIGAGLAFTGLDDVQTARIRELVASVSP